MSAEVRSLPDVHHVEQLKQIDRVLQVCPLGIWPALDYQLIQPRSKACILLGTLAQASTTISTGTVAVSGAITSPVSA